LCIAAIADQSVQAKRKASRSHGTVIPGIAVGELRLGDSKSRALTLFPFKPNIDQEYQSVCGRELNWVDRKKPYAGNIFIHFQDNMVLQIDAATTRFETADGITAGMSPEKVQAHYTKLRAYVLSNVTSGAFGERPLIYWVDRDSGIAFAFAYSKTLHIRYLYDIAIFHPNSEICPMNGPINSSDKRELPPYSLEPNQ
jgi:hypothetical protein